MGEDQSSLCLLNLTGLRMQGVLIFLVLYGWSFLCLCLCLHELDVLELGLSMIHNSTKSPRKSSIKSYTQSRVQGRKPSQDHVGLCSLLDPFVVSWVLSPCTSFMFQEKQEIVSRSPSKKDSSSHGLLACKTRECVVFRFFFARLLAGLCNMFWAGFCD